MNTERVYSVTQYSILRIAIATAVILLVPFVAMQITDQLTWDVTDFLTLGVLIFGAGLAYELVTKVVSRTHRVAIGLAVAAALLWVWAELAVGVFTNWGS